MFSIKNFSHVINHKYIGLGMGPLVQQRIVNKSRKGRKRLKDIVMTLRIIAGYIF